MAKEELLTNKDSLPVELLVSLRPELLNKIHLGDSFEFLTMPIIHSVKLMRYGLTCREVVTKNNYKD